MKVLCEEKQNNKQVVEAGDIIWWKNSNSPQIITKIRVCDNINKISGVNLDGVFWDSNPQLSVDEGNAILYKASEWELVLRKKN